VFAWHAVPPGPGPHPGIVLVHGGGHTAYADWARLWAARGYHALAIDCCGSTPGGFNAHPRHAHAGPPGWGGFEHGDQPIEDQWPYHAVAAILAARAWLAGVAGADPARIALTGVSWGGFLSILAAAAEPRFAAVAPVYGCGHLADGSAWVPDFVRLPAAAVAAWLACWDPAVHLPALRCPSLWLTGTNDAYFPLGAWQASTALAAGPVARMVRARWAHEHRPSEAVGEVRRFCDHLLGGGPPLPSVTATRADGGRAVAQVADLRSPAVVELLATRARGPWAERWWEILPARLEADGTLHAALPAGTTAWILNATDAEGFTASSAVIACD
jgi:dienelactone hydrolase